MEIVKLLSLLKTCIGSKSLVKGKLIHQKIITLGLHNNLALCKNLISFYFSCHLHRSADRVFKTIHKPLDIFLWNGLMAAYTKNFMFFEALEHFEKLWKYPYLKPNTFTYPSLLKACGGLGSVVYGKMIHTHLIKVGFLYDVVVASSLVGMYAKCNMFEQAKRMFDEMPERDVACWNTVISCYYQDGKAEKALEFFGKMRDAGFEPNSVTLTIIISSCARLMDLERGKEIHREMVKNGLVLDGFLRSALVDMYGKCGCIKMAREVFEQIPEKGVVTWNTMIAGYSSIGDSQSCIQLFKRMNVEGMIPSLTTLSSILVACSRSVQLHHGKCIHGYMIRNMIEADIFVNNSLIDLYFKCGNVHSAENIFKMMPKTDIVSWNAMISGYVSLGKSFDALGIHEIMIKVCVNPDAVTFTSVLAACTQLAALENGKEIHNSITENKLERNEVVMGALLDMYAKCGAVDEAFRIFCELPERDLVSWTSMITAYGSHGQALDALKLFGKMQQSNAKPNGVTFLAVLSACSHGGLVDEGCYYFKQMTSEHSIKPQLEHYSCLIDLLGRAGRLHEAYEILQSTPETREDVKLLSTLFYACHLHRCLELGEKIAEFLIEKNPDDSSIYIILSNMYASAKKWNKVGKVRLKMKELGLKKKPGCSWIEVDQRIQPFFVEDN
ncbi:pentatricopeptide repeat-containing protein At5g27110-like [Durio zibethinus]|uniref:Pentatricopeptide repeat-containing protein At5g27110-like n=1 Tax=Durio zibethinus TaxID=66656 RepID=A0A6P5ZTS5_DURZI|nr:pentatricopeptide repeat-containing protein At5g27110-like [Durio zibethinus]